MSFCRRLSRETISISKSSNRAPHSFIDSLTPSIKQLEKGYRSSKNRSNIRFQRISPQRLRSIIEIIITNLRYRRLLCRLWSSVWTAVEGRHASIVYEYVYVACFFGDGVDCSLEIFVGCCATLNGDDVAVLLEFGLAIGWYPYSGMVTVRLTASFAASWSFSSRLPVMYTLAPLLSRVRATIRPSPVPPARDQTRINSSERIVIDSVPPVTTTTNPLTSVKFLYLEAIAQVAVKSDWVRQRCSNSIRANFVYYCIFQTKPL